MALIKCPECGKEISDSVLVCPNCGKQLREPKRSFIGKVFKWLFYGYNAFMLLWLVGGLSNVSEMEAHSAAEQAGAAIGTGMGVMFILIIWFFGAGILGLLTFVTRAKK